MEDRIENILEDINLGLSDAEKTDLEDMISAFKNNQSPGQPFQDYKVLEAQIGSIGNKLSQYAELLLKNDKKIKMLYEILRLSDQKTRIINQRIDAVLNLMKEKNILVDI